MKRYSYTEPIKPTSEQLLISTINSWISYAENKQKRNAKSSKYVKWKCFCCSKEIYVHCETNSCKSLYCSECRPKRLYKTGIHLRYLMMFRNHVRALLIRNTNMDSLFK